MDGKASGTNSRVSKDWDNFTVTARNANGDITQVEYYDGTRLVRTIDLTYDTDGCLVEYRETEA